MRLVLALPLALACTRPPAPLPPPPPPPAFQAAPASVMGALVAANVAWADAYVRGDSATLAAAYTDDAALMTDNGDVTGRLAIRDWLLAHRAAGPDTVIGTSTATDQLDVAGDRAYEAGTLVWTVAPRTAPTRAREVRVRYATFWRQAPDGRWLMARSLKPLP